MVTAQKRGRPPFPGPSYQDPNDLFMWVLAIRFIKLEIKTKKKKIDLFKASACNAGDPV